MDLRVALWTFGMALGGILLGEKAVVPYGTVAVVIGAASGAALGFTLGSLFSYLDNRKKS